MASLFYVRCSFLCVSLLCLVWLSVPVSTVSPQRVEYITQWYQCKVSSVTWLIMCRVGRETPPTHLVTHSQTLEFHSTVCAWCTVLAAPTDASVHFLTLVLNYSGVNPNLFWGGEIFSLTGKRGMKPEARRAESGDGVLGEGAASPPPVSTSTCHCGGAL